MSDAAVLVPIATSVLAVSAALGRWGVLGLLIFTLVFWGAVIVGLILLIRWGAKSTRIMSRARTVEAIDILRRRYASGEISIEEFEERRRNLLSSLDRDGV